MPTFDYWSVDPRSGSRHKGCARALDEACLREDLAKRGITPTRIEPLPDPPATTAQIDFMRERGILAPARLTIAEAADLIDNHVRHTGVAAPGDFEMARKFKVEVSRYASTTTIYRSILFELMREGDGERLGAWFAYCVCRDALERAHPQASVPFDPSDARFFVIGARIAFDGSLAASLQHAAKASRTYFRRFGDFQEPDGARFNGDNNGTHIYRFTMSAVAEAGLLRPGPDGAQGASREAPPATLASRGKHIAGRSLTFAAMIAAIALAAFWLI
jgi:hypothetical protein